MTTWQFDVPDEGSDVPPPFAASRYPVGTVATNDQGDSWINVWDEETSSPMWVQS